MFGLEGARDSTEDMLGRVVDNRYKILESMASGSMGTVFKAERIPVGKLVAIKFLHAGFANDSEFLARFERETRVMSKLAHPNCVSVVDFGVWEGAPYLVMEYVAGKTLRQILDGSGAMQPMRALAITKQIAAGLAHAHTHGIVHRDVKPANIMITEEIGAGEHVRILDFGLARLRGAVGRDATQTNVVVGTPNYMAPEQTVGGSTIDARTDVYAVGVVLFEMICGQRPFQAEDTLALLGMHRAAPIPKVADRVEQTVTLPAGLQDLIDTAMAKAPEDRFQTAIELTEAIEAMTSPVRTPAPGGIVVSPSARMKSGAVKQVVSNAPTMTDVTQTDQIEHYRKPSSKLPIILVLLVLVGGAYAAWKVTHRKTEETTTHADEPGSGTAAKLITVDAATAKSKTPDAKGATPDAAVAQAPVDASTITITDVTPDATEIVITNPVDLNEPDQEDPNPEVAPNPVPEDPNKPAPDDEADDAPKSDKEVEKHVEKQVPSATAAPQLATTVRGSLRLIQAGKNDLALASLRKIWPKQKASGYIPFLLGNLYFDKQWWSVAMDHYKVAIQKSAGYKKNPTLIRNVIRTLGSVKTNKRAQAFLRMIGRSAVPYLKYAAAHDKNPHVKKWAAYMARTIR